MKEKSEIGFGCIKQKCVDLKTQSCFQQRIKTKDLELSEVENLFRYLQEVLEAPSGMEVSCFEL